MKSLYKNTHLPSWVKDASREHLIEHIQYLTHNAERDRKAIVRARYRYVKAEKKLRELSE